MTHSVVSCLLLVWTSSMTYRQQLGTCCSSRAMHSQASWVSVLCFASGELSEWVVSW
jgi:hypothetical protein